MAYYLGIKANQTKEGIFVSEKGYVKAILKRFGMENCKHIGTPIEYGAKLSKHDEGEAIDGTSFKSLVGSLRYLTCTRPDILFVMWFTRCFVEAPTTSHLKGSNPLFAFSHDPLPLGVTYKLEKIWFSIYGDVGGYGGFKVWKYGIKIYIV